MNLQAASILPKRLANSVKDDSTTTKEKILSVLQSLDENTSIDEAIERLYLLRKVEIGIGQADRGKLLDHDEFMKQLALKS